MDKRLLAVFIILLFFIPIVLNKAFKPPDGPSIRKDPAVAACETEITVEGEDKPLPLEEYIVGVVASEMPVTYSSEALKAQAIAARTYALKETAEGTKPIGRGTGAQVYANKKERKERWGKAFKENEKKIRAAVDATAGDILVHEGGMITAMFFSTSNGQTETAENFTGNPVPYLQSVDSPDEQTVSEQVERSVDMPLRDWNQKLGVSWKEADFRALQLVRNETGRVQQVLSGSTEFSGRDIREKLGLASTDFNIGFDVANKVVHITTKGYGHGVGMSQNGAEAYAKKGWTAEKIVSHYYTGAEVKKFEKSESQCLKTP
ncbi:stage II sporulation protein D [Sporosarcina sp. NCCP-2716]|uniref:stage II sporulation protein D n=1 Tax=Sporosarcina sp. NCCP-2716 TaxID=2943679 RepID=UPI002041D32B|nr:stage II sporulation protein D [Sporosarcina sp. NCCP-2716]GKV69164.1 stage II sporulation protein D [Sporosarcina sp. NCCP-2716]